MLITNPRLAPRLGMSGGIPPFAPYVFVTWTGKILLLRNYYSVLLAGKQQRANELDSWYELYGLIQNVISLFAWRNGGNPRKYSVVIISAQPSFESDVCGMGVCCKLKINLPVITTWKHMEELKYCFTLSLTSALDGCEWPASRTGRFFPRRAPNIHWLGNFPFRGSNRYSSVISSPSQILVPPPRFLCDCTRNLKAVGGGDRVFVYILYYLFWKHCTMSVNEWRNLWSCDL